MRAIVHPADWLAHAEPPELSGYGRRLLAGGDSWFTIGTLNLAAASNVLFKLQFSQSTVIVNCAVPGDTLQHMVERMHDPLFDRLLRKPRFARHWEAILVSAGGNDLIDAAQVPPEAQDGVPIGPESRLLLQADEPEAALGTGPERHISRVGWERFARYLQANFEALLERRDEGPSRGRPILLHTYATPVVRPAGTLGVPQGWLWPALRRMGLEGEAAQAVSDTLFARLRRLLMAFDQDSGQPQACLGVHVFDSAALTQIEPAQPASRGVSGDWVNEIHLTPGGYDKLGRAFGAWIEQVLAAYP